MDLTIVSGTESIIELSVLLHCCKSSVYILSALLVHQTANKLAMYLWGMKNELLVHQTLTLQLHGVQIESILANF